MNMRAKLSFIARDDGGWMIKAEPHPVFRATVKTWAITDSDKRLIERWIKERGMIQDYLPHWSGAAREVLLSGMDDPEFKAYCGDEDHADG